MRISDWKGTATLRCMESDADALLAAFDSGEFVRPDWSQPNPVSLARAISSFGGHSPWQDDPATIEVRNRIGEPEHLVVVIADGFGMNFVNSLPDDSFSRLHLGWEQPAAFPSSTGPNMTALFSGEHPATHGFTGWWVYLPPIGERATVYEWVRSSDGMDLGVLGVKPRDVFLSEPFPGRLAIDCKLLMPAALEDSLPTLCSEAGGAPVEGYEEFTDGVEKAVERVRSANGRSLTFLYWGMVDLSAHIYGEGSKEAAESVGELDAGLGELASGVEGKARLIVTADHGHLDVKKYLQLDPAHSLARLMKCTQSGEPRANYFHVKEGETDRFAGEFREQFGDEFFLLSTNELLELRLLGPESPTAAVRERLGDFCAISRQGAIVTSRVLGDRTDLLKSTHGGLSAAEMMVPVLLA